MGTNEHYCLAGHLRLDGYSWKLTSATFGSCSFVARNKTNEFSGTTPISFPMIISLATNGHKWTLMPCGAFKTGWILVKICVHSWLEIKQTSFRGQHLYHFHKIRTHEPCVPTGQWMSRLKIPLAFHWAGRDARLVRPQFMPFAIDTMRNVWLRWTHECVPTGLCDCSLGWAKCLMCLGEFGAWGVTPLLLLTKRCSLGHTQPQ